MNTNLFEQARTLAENLLNTPEGKKYQEAKYIFEGDDVAINKLQEYAKMRQNFQIRMQRGDAGEDFENDRQNLNKMIEDVKSDEVISNLFKAEEIFNQMVSSVMDIFNATLIGESEEAQGGCCNSGCGGCSGCH
ncbi:MAG: YlbF family regulator [Eubacteriales bacterium]|nr:YlbF family regulator [Eubacteriales bacterium]